MNLDDCEKRIVLLGPDSSDEGIAELLCRLKGMQDRIGQLQEDLEAKMVEKIKQTGQDIVIGPVRYYVGTPKTVKCRDQAAAVLAVLDLSGGDVARFSQFLASTAFKPGAINKALLEAGRGGEFDQLFETTYPEKLETGKPKKQLMKVDTRFVK